MQRAERGREKREHLIALRLGLLGSAVIFFELALVAWGQGRAFAYPLNGALSAGLWIIAVCCGLLSLVRSPPWRAAWLILAGAVLIGVYITISASPAAPPTTYQRTDNEMIGRYAVEALKRGYNPYSLIYTDLTRVFLDRGETLTPFLDGAFQNRVTYPALPTLTLWLADRLGTTGRTINLIAYCGLLLLLFVRAPAAWRPLVLFPLLLMHLFPSLAISGVQDVVWSALLVGVLAAWKRPGLRAILFGLACSYRQQPWLIAPFLAILIGYEHVGWRARIRAIGEFSGISAGLFIAINGPFALNDFQGWRLGVLEPTYAPFNDYSQGLSMLSALGVWPMPRAGYAVLQVTVYGLGLLLLLLHPNRLRRAIWLIPMLVFWVYYRALVNYWVFWLPPFLFVSVRETFRLHRPHVRSRWPVTTLCSAGAALVAAIALAWLLTQNAALSAEVIYPLRSGIGGAIVTQLQVRVTNTSSRAVRPRFAVQNQPGIQPLPWITQAGSELLPPGASDTYQITSGALSNRAIAVNSDAQIVITDGNLDPSVRASIRIETGSDNPDLIRNAAFQVWSDRADTPDQWALNTPAGATVRLSLAPINGRDALIIRTLRAATDGTTTEPVQLTQVVSYDVPFTVWGYLPSLPDDPTSAYGIAIDDGFQCFRLLFVSGPQFRPAAPCITVAVPIALRTWTPMTVNLPDLYRHYGKRSPPISVRQTARIPYLVRQVRLSLLAGAGREEQTWAFGEISQKQRSASSGQHIMDLIDEPAAYYQSIAYTNFALGNVDLGMRAYIRAIIEAALSWMKRGL